MLSRLPSYFKAARLLERLSPAPQGAMAGKLAGMAMRNPVGRKLAATVVRHEMEAQVQDLLGQPDAQEELAEGALQALDPSGAVDGLPQDALEALAEEDAGDASGDGGFLTVSQGMLAGRLGRMALRSRAARQLAGAAVLRKMRKPLSRMLKAAGDEDGLPMQALDALGEEDPRAALTTLALDTLEQKIAEGALPVRCVDALGHQLLCHMLNGRLHGPWEKRTRDGRLLMQAFYRHGRLHGLMTLFDAAGRPSHRGKFLNGLPHGGMEVFSRGVRLSLQQFVKGRLQGLSESYDHLGQLSSRLHYQQGRLHGMAEFFRWGKRLRQARYLEGRLNGQCLDFGLKGNLVQRSQYHHNMLHGPLTRFRADGAVLHQSRFMGGMLAEPGAQGSAGARQSAAASRSGATMTRMRSVLRGGA